MKFSASRTPFSSLRVQALRLTRTLDDACADTEIHASEAQDFHVDATFANDGAKEALFAFGKAITLEG